MKTSEELYVNLHAILNDSSGEGGFNVNVLTTQKRKDWAEDRETLRGVGNNGAMMDILESALFAVCIDQDATWTNNEEAALHGFTHRQDRNFDLPFQVCCMPDGNFYEICAHGPFDATHVAPFLEYCFRHEDDLLARFEKPEITQPHDFTDQTQDGNDFHPAILRFAEPADIRTKLQQLDSVPLNPGLDIKEFVFTGFGKELLKAGGHPDSVIQMAFQLAYALMHRGDHPQVLGVNTYEALSARHFHGCRTFQGHPRSVASEAFVSKMLARDASGDVTTDVIDALCNGVNTLSLDSATTLKGFSEDRHLFALYCLSLMNGKTPPEFLRTSMETLTKYKLSTSQVRQDFGEGGIFRPSERDGYGLLYRINLDGEIRVSISSYVKESGKTAIDFAGFLRQALELMEPVLRKRQVK